MAKDNLFLGMARGKVGDVVFSRVNGQQVSRVRNRSPRNPQTPAQMIQRAVTSTIGKAYSLMQGLCDHSFEGFEGNALNQQRFMVVNIAKFRDALAPVIEYPTWENIDQDDSHLAFNLKGDYLPALNEYIISEGTLPQMNLVVDYDADKPYTCYKKQKFLVGLTSVPANPPTYAQMCEYLGVQQGDQLTFIIARMSTLGAAHTLCSFRYARVIMEPNDGDMTAAFLSALSQGTVNKPNTRNEGNIIFDIAKEQDSAICHLTWYLDPEMNTREVAFAIILSRQSGEKWLRSNQTLCFGSNADYLYGDPDLMGAIQSMMPSTSGSDLYLNQAE